MRPYFYDITVILSLIMMTLGIIGIWRMPDVYTKLHAASKAVFLGVVTITLSATVISSGAMTLRALLIALLVLATTPVTSHLIGRAAYVIHEQMETPGAIDESQTLVKDQSPTWRI